MDATHSNPRPTESTTVPPLRLAGSAVVMMSVAPDQERTEHLQREARALLAALKIDRSRVEAKLAEFGRTDPIAEVKGKSALDEAIESCQSVIEELDRLADVASAHGAQ